jgi:hypothetical protein
LSKRSEEPKTCCAITFHPNPKISAISSGIGTVGKWDFVDIDIGVTFPVLAAVRKFNTDHMHDFSFLGQFIKPLFKMP